MANQYTAVIKEDGDWWIGWVQEIPGVNCQESSRDELLVSLRETLAEAIELNRDKARKAADADFSIETLTLRNERTWLSTYVSTGHPETVTSYRYNFTARFA